MMIEHRRLRATAAELVRQFGCWQEQAMLRPVYITHHGRDRLVLMSVAAYVRRAEQEPATADAPLPPSTIEPLLEQLSEGFVAFDPSLRVTALNPAAAAYLRLVRAETLGEKLFEQAEAMRRSLLYGQLTRALQSGEIGAFDLPSPAFDGRWLHVRTFPYAGGTACLLRDITEEVAGRRLADASATTLVALAAHGGVGRVRLSPRGTFVQVDDAFSAMSGFAPETLARARLTDVLPLNRRVAAAREIEAVLSGAPARAFESALLVNDGGELPVRIALAELRGDYGSDGAIAVVTPLATAQSLA